VVAAAEKGVRIYDRSDAACGRAGRPRPPASAEGAIGCRSASCPFLPVPRHSSEDGFGGGVLGFGVPIFSFLLPDLWVVWGSRAARAFGVALDFGFELPARLRLASLPEARGGSGGGSSAGRGRGSSG